MRQFKAIERILQRRDRELWLLTSQAGRRRGALIVTSVMQVSIVPTMPRLLVALARYHHTRSLIARSRRFILHLLAVKHLNWVWHFGGRTGRLVDKLKDYPLARHERFPRLKGVPAWLDCRVEASFDSGDCTLYLAAITRGRALRTYECLTTERLVKMAPAERLRELTQRQRRDARLDADAIRAWRKRHGRARA
jgi:flavin reductase (DIM6/NTAB) family NADH-FMN oxidoreductase RutF